MFVKVELAVELAPTTRRAAGAPRFLGAFATGTVARLRHATTPTTAAAAAAPIHSRTPIQPTPASPDAVAAGGCTRWPNSAQRNHSARRRRPAGRGALSHARWTEQDDPAAQDEHPPGLIKRPSTAPIGANRSVSPNPVDGFARSERSLRPPALDQIHRSDEVRKGHGEAADGAGGDDAEVGQGEVGSDRHNVRAPRSGAPRASTGLPAGPISSVPDPI